MKSWFETPERTENGLPIAVIHNTYEEAEEYANAKGINHIYEVGGYFGDYERCWGCNEFFEGCEISEVGLCESCDARGYEHGF